MLTRVIFFIAFTLITSSAAAAENYIVPDLSKATLTLEEKQVVAGRKDMTRAPEITIRTYKEPDGELVRQFSVNGAVFRYDVAPKGKPPYEYRLLDKDGDGNFETKEQLVGETEAGGKKVPYYIDLGPQPG
ncbi:MAG TPA: DUF2782 domain-containing protein, partial [Nitrospirota bacterium]